MRKLKIGSALLFLGIFSSAAFAATEGNTLTVTIENLSSQTLHYKNSISRSGSVCDLSELTIAPKQTVLITGKYDPVLGNGQGLFCRYTFLNDQRQDVSFTMLDPIAIYQGTGVYEFSGISAHTTVYPSHPVPLDLLNRHVRMTIQ